MGGNLKLRRAIGRARRGIELAFIAVFIGGAALLSIAMLPVLFQGKSADAAKPQAAVPLQGANKSNAPPSDIMAAQNRLIELRFLKGPADGVLGSQVAERLARFQGRK